METWTLLAISTIFSAGMHSFLMKVATERNYNVPIINFYSGIASFILACVYLISQWGDMHF